MPDGGLKAIIKEKVAINNRNWGIFAAIFQIVDKPAGFSRSVTVDEVLDHVRKGAPRYGLVCQCIWVKAEDFIRRYNPPLSVIFFFFFFHGQQHPDHPADGPQRLHRPNHEMNIADRNVFIINPEGIP